MNTSRVISDIELERQRQIDKGFTAEHDDEHSVRELMRFAFNYTDQVEFHTTDPVEIRKNLVKAAAVLVAAIEFVDRNS